MTATIMHEPPPVACFCVLYIYIDRFQEDIMSKHISIYHLCEGLEQYVYF